MAITSARTLDSLPFLIAVFLVPTVLRGNAYPGSDIHYTEISIPPSNLSQFKKPTTFINQIFILETIQLRPASCSIRLHE